MQNYRECFKKVRKDCIKYIQSQETKKEKFKNKDQLIKSHIIPLCFWINKRRKNKSKKTIELIEYFEKLKNLDDLTKDKKIIDIKKRKKTYRKRKFYKKTK